MGMQKAEHFCIPIHEMAKKAIDFCPSIGYTPRCQENASGFGVVVTCNFPKVEITGSNPVTRS